VRHHLAKPNREIRSDIRVYGRNYPLALFERTK